MKQGIFRATGFNPDDGSTEGRGYTQFMEGQSLAVLILLAFSGSTLVGADFRQKSLAFYLSRRIDRRHYILGKLLAVGVLISLLTMIPALLLFVEFSLFKGSTAYFLEHWHTPVSIVAYGLTLSVALGIWLVTLSAYLQRLVPIAITWVSTFILLGRFGALLSAETGNKRWRLIGPWHDIREVGRLCFPSLLSVEDRRIALWALAILATLCGVCLVALVRRVRAVDIVQ